jgi:hypothetical protein
MVVVVEDREGRSRGKEGKEGRKEGRTVEKCFEYL